MAAPYEFLKKLQSGTVYKRAELLEWSNSLDRHLKILIEDGFLKKCGPGLYLCLDAKKGANTEIDETEIITKFLGDNRFLIVSRKSYLNVGLPNSGLHTRTVYNHKRHGQFSLGGIEYNFRVKPYLPLITDREFLLVDIVNNLDEVDEAERAGHENYLRKHLSSSNKTTLRLRTEEYGDARAKKYMKAMI